MSWLLTEPRTVVVVTTPGEHAESLRGAVSAGVAEEVVERSAVDAAVETLTARDDVGCVVATDDVTGESLAGVCERLTAANERVPVVARASDGSEAAAYRATAAGAWRYLPSSVDDDALTAAVDEAIEVYEIRRDEAADSSILRTLLEDSQLPIYAKDIDARVVRMSAVPMGADPDAAVGQTDFELFGDRTDDVEAMYEDDMAVLDSEEPIRAKLERLEFPDHVVWQETTKVPWYGPDGDLAGLVGVTVNVDDRMELELQRDNREMEMEAFTRYVSHDLRTPLQVASGNLELARTADDEEAFETAERALDRLDEMIDDLSTLALRIGDGEGPGGSDGDLHADAGVELTDVARTVWEVVGTEAAALDVALPEEARIYAAETSVRPVFENLLKNAVDHVGGDVTVTVGATDDGGFYVEDDGQGIPPEKRETVFERGFTTRPGGSGTGLNIVAATADQLGWRYEVVDGTDGGARFEFHECTFVPDPTRRFDTADSLAFDAATDVGDTRVSGEVSVADDRVEVAGGGRDLWGFSNEFHFYHTRVDGAVRVQGRLAALDAPHEFGKAGLVVRNGLDPDACYGGVCRTEDRGLELLWRMGRGEKGANCGLADASHYEWFRVDRVGDTVRLSLSADGRRWRPIDERTLPLDGAATLGLFVCSHMPGTLATAVFEDVDVVRLSGD